MSTAFTLTLAYLGEHSSAADAAGAFAAYITGNVASNLVGRLVAGGRGRPLRPRRQLLSSSPRSIWRARCWSGSPCADAPADAAIGSPASPLGALRRAISQPAAAAPASRIGFCILFAFIGTFTYVNFVLVRPPLAIGHDVAGLRLFRLPAVDRH